MNHINPFPPISRRESLHRMGAGFGTLGLASLLASPVALASPAVASVDSLSPKLAHFAPKAKRMIQLFMPGGPSQVDTFDYKPEIAKYAGQRPSEVDRKSLRNTKNGLFPSPFEFKQYGECGRWVSDLFPHVGQCVDDICFIHSMHTDIPEHAGAIMMMNVGQLQPNRPSLGSWLVYGLGTENQNLPGFVAMSPRARPRGGFANWGNSFLPGAYGGCYVNIAEMKPESVVHDLQNRFVTTSDQRKQIDLLGRLNRIHADQGPSEAALESRIASMEMAFRMQFSVPEAFEISGETRSTLEMYGDSEYAKGCLLARRLMVVGERAGELSASIDSESCTGPTLPSN